MAIDKIDSEMPEEISSQPEEKPATSLLRSWGKRMAKGDATVIPVFVGGSWTLQVPRGNKRVLRLGVPEKSKDKKK